MAASDSINALRILLTAQPQPDSTSSPLLRGFSKTELSRGIDLLHSLAGARAPALSSIAARSGESASLSILVGGRHLRRI